VRLDRQRNRRGFEACPLARGEESDRDMAAYSVSDLGPLTNGLPKIKSQEPVRIPRDPDPDALPNFAGS
jgi:hypothetical protein